MSDMKRWLFILITLTSLLVTGCSDKLQFWKFLPLQLSRVTQKENFKQTFLIEVDENDARSATEIDKLKDTRLDEVFTSLVGSKNWQYLKNHYGIRKIRDELVTGGIHIKGMINFNAYLDPLDRSDDELYVVLEGSGRFFTIRNLTQAILLSGDLDIKPQRVPVKSLKDGCIPLRVQLYTTRIPGETTFNHSVDIRYNIYMTSRSVDTYSIDYAAVHNGFLKTRHSGNYEHVANLRFDPEFSHVKLIDLRGSELIKDKYRINDSVKVDIRQSNDKPENNSCFKRS